MLQSGAHIRIGAYDLDLDTKTDDPYLHVFQSLFPPVTVWRDITGEPGERQVRQEKDLWTFSDWSGGEGNRRYYADDPTVFHQTNDAGNNGDAGAVGGANPRIRGQLQGPPGFTTSTLTVSDGKQQPCTAVACGALWMACGTALYYSTDGITFTLKSATAVSAGNIQSIAGDDDYVYISAFDGANRIVRRCSIAGALADVVSSATATAPFVGMATLNGRLYGWTGRRLFEHDVFQTLPLVLGTTYRKVFDSGVDITGTEGVLGAWWGDCIGTDDSIVVFTSTVGQTKLWKVFQGVPSPLWKMPYGFSGKSGAFENGILYIAGHWTSGPGAMYAMNMRNYGVTPVGYFRKDTLPLQMQIMSTSYDNQILICAALTGRIFVYDANTDGISLLRRLSMSSTQAIGAVATFGSRRVAVVYDPSNAGAVTTVTIVSIKDDEPANMEASDGVTAVKMMGVDSGVSDMQIPMETKILGGFKVTHKPLLAGQTITISYQLEDSGSWTALAPITSATPGNSIGRTFVPVSDGTTTKTFFSLEFRVETSSGIVNAQTPPIVKAVVPDADLLAREEIWQLRVRLKDDTSNERPRSRAWSGEMARDFFLTAVSDRKVVTLLDGWRYRQPGKFTTHTVVIDEVQDAIGPTSGEGTALVKLRAIQDT